MAGRIDVESPSAARQTPPPTRPKRRTDPPVVVRQTQAAGLQVEEKHVVVGFHPLRSLRNIFFGYRRKEKRTSDATCSKAKSTDDLEPKLTGSSALKQARRQSCPFNKQLSLSADNLLDASEIEWKPAPPDTASFGSSSTPTASTSLTPSKLKSASLSEESVVHTSTSNLLSHGADEEDATEEFFKDNWSKSRPRATSADVMFEGTQDLDAILISSQHLNLMAAKDKIAVRQKGKRVSTALTHKMGASNHWGSQTLIEEIENEEQEQHPIIPPIEKQTIRQSSRISKASRKSSIDTTTCETSDDKKNVVDSKKGRLSLLVQAKSDAAESKAKLPKCRRSSDVSATIPTLETSSSLEASCIPESPEANQRIYARLKKLEFTPVKSPRTKKQSGAAGGGDAAATKKTH